MVHSKAIRYSLIIIIILGCAIVAHRQWQQQLSGHPKLIVLDIGQGDAIYLHTQQGADILIDGGPDRTVLERLGQEMPFWDRTIELVVLTHPHADHLNGLMALLDYYHIEQVWLAQVPQDHNSTYQLWLRALTEQQAAIHYVDASYSWQLSNHETLQVLYPFVGMPLEQIKDLNDTSLVLEYELDNHRVLLMGDATEKVEVQLLAQQVLTPVDILKVGHHGSRYSSSPEFLAIVQPRYAIISAGIDNSYHHPHDETIQRLQSAQVLRTDQTGSVELSLPPP